MNRKIQYLIIGVALFFGADSIFAMQTGNRGENSRRSSARQQPSLPSVTDLVKKFDANEDGKLSKEEVVDQRFKRQFDRWDTDKDGLATVDEISALRKRFGIPIEGSSGGSTQRPAQRDSRRIDDSSPPALTIPDVEDLPRVDRSTRISRDAAKNSAYLIKTQSHSVDGERYVILTDHKDPGYLKSLERLAKHHDGIIVHVDDLALLHKHDEVMADVRKQLQQAKVKFIAIAPRMETYRENMLLGMLELMTTLDEDPQLDAYPGFLLASSEETLAGLVDRSINSKPQTAKEFRPFAISQVPSLQELRSLQKSGILRNYFLSETPTVAIYSPGAKEAPQLPGDKFWTYHVKSRGDFVKKFPNGAANEFEKATLLVMHGHGIPGMSCGVDISALANNHSMDVVMCGSCFSAAPKNSDLPAMRQAPGGYNVEAKDSFAIRAIDNGASVAFGHMRLSAGFPHLFPVLESWAKGQTVGKAYQEMMNGIIEQKGMESGDFVITNTNSGGRQPKQNALLYVVIGDPALQPFEALVGN